MFKEVEPMVGFPKLERRILKFWKEADAFKERVALNRDKKRWSFLDGPITANKRLSGNSDSSQSVTSRPTESPNSLEGVNRGPFATPPCRLNSLFA